MIASTNGAGVVVAIADSGWDYGVTEPRVGQGVGLVDPTDDLRLAETADAQDRLGHGTACADLVLQVAPAAHIIPIRIFGKRLETSPEILFAAIDWAVDHRVNVLNLSLTIRRRDALLAAYTACERAKRAGTIVVAATGPSSSESFIPTFDSVIAVSGTRARDRLAVRCQDGATPNFGASLIQRARVLHGRVTTVAGTSFAAPVVSGHVARLLTDLPRRDLQSVRASLSRMAVHYVDAAAVTDAPASCGSAQRKRE